MVDDSMAMLWVEWTSAHPGRKDWGEAEFNMLPRQMESLSLDLNASGRPWLHSLEWGVTDG